MASEKLSPLTVLEIQLIKHEGMRLLPYHCTAGKLTIGVGRNLEESGISRDEAVLLLRNDIERFATALDKRFPWFRSLSEIRQRALIDMSFMGMGKVLEFKRMLAALEAFDYATAAAEMLASKWASQVGTRARTLATLLRDDRDPCIDNQRKDQ
jgi:lysozyme